MREAAEPCGRLRPQALGVTPAEKAEMADAASTDIARRDTAHLARRSGVKAVLRLGVDARHELVIGQGQREDRRRDARVLRSHVGSQYTDAVVAVQAPAAPLLHDASRKIAPLLQAPPR